MPAEPVLTPQVLAVLGVLLKDPSRSRYGLEIAREAGLKTGTLHPILGRLEQAGWLERYWESPPEDAGRPRRRYYRFTSGGAASATAAITAREPRAPRANGLRPQPGF